MHTVMTCADGGFAVWFLRDNFRIKVATSRDPILCASAAAYLNGSGAVPQLEKLTWVGHS